MGATHPVFLWLCWLGFRFLPAAHSISDIVVSSHLNKGPWEQPVWALESPKGRTRQGVRALGAEPRGATPCGQETSPPRVGLGLLADEPALAFSGPHSRFDDVPGPEPASRLCNPAVVQDPVLRRPPVWIHALLAVTLLKLSVTF